MSIRPLIPSHGTLERIMFDALCESDKGVTFLDLVGTGITEENIEQIVQNLRTGMFIADNDDELGMDA